MEEDSTKRTGSEASAPRRGAARFSARRPTPLSNALLVVVTVLAVFCAAELVLRVVYHPENLHSVVRFDDVLGWSLKPRANFRSVDNADGLCYRIQTNSLGMREREFDRQKKPGRKRILVIGDSIVFGTGVDAKWRFSDFLARAFGDEAEVLNAGVCGWGNDQELLYYETKGRALRPDIVILTFTMANDVLNNMLGHLFLASAPKPRFVLDGENLVLEKRNLDPPRPGFARRVKNVLRGSRVLVFVKRRVDTVRYETRVRHEAAGVHAGFDREGLEKNCSHWSVYESSYGPGFEEAWRVTEAILSRFARDCEEDGTRFFVFVFPLQLVVDEHWRNGLIRDFSVDSTGFDFERPYRRLSAFCGDHGIDYFYPVEAFREASKGRSLYFERDSHPNKWGHAAAAGALLENLHERIGLEYRVAGVDRDLMYPQVAAPVETGEQDQTHN